MKLFLSTAVIFVLLVKPPPTYSSDVSRIRDEGLEMLISKLTECIRTLLKGGVEEWGLPPLDPLEHQGELPLQFDDAFLKGDLNLTNPKVVGVTQFLADVEVTMTSLLSRKIDLKLNFTSSKVTGKYSSKKLALLGVVKLFGKGDIDVEVLDFVVHVSLTFKNLKLKLDKISATLGTEPNINITGLFHDENLSKFVSGYLKAIIVSLFEEYGLVIGNKAVSLANQMVDNHYSEFSKKIDIIKLCTNKTASALNDFIFNIDNEMLK